MSAGAPVRRARRDDVSGILAIANHFAIHTTANFAIEPEAIETWLETFDATQAKHPWLVTEADGAIIGFAKSSPWKGRCAYAHSVEVTVYLRPGAEGRGLGRALYERLFAILRAQGYRSALGGITLPNDPSVRLHEAMGMRRVALFERIGFKFGQWHDVGYWEVTWGDGPPTPVRAVDDVLAATT